MKILRDNEWILRAIEPEGFVFQHRKYDDVLIVRRAKFINTEFNIVYFLDVTAEEIISVSYSSRYKIKQSYSHLVNLLNDLVAMMQSLGSAASNIVNCLEQ